MNRPTPTLHPARTAMFYVALGMVTVVMVARLAQLQLFESETYITQATENRLSRVNAPAPRGVIYDRNGVVLALNVPAYNITIVPAALPSATDEPARREAILRQLAEILDMPLTVPGSKPQRPCTPGRGVQDLVDEFKDFRPFEAFKLKCDIPKDLALTLREQVPDLPGVGIAVEPLRSYPTGELTAGLIGYMAPIPDPNESAYFRELYDYYTGRDLLPGRDRVGVSGLEASLQDELAGQNGIVLIEKDVGGQILGTYEVETTTAPGLNLQLTIDTRLQAAAEAAMSYRINYVNTFNNNQEFHNGVAIVMNPNTGEILAMVSWPAFDNNRFARAIDVPYYEALSTDPYYPMLNHAVNILYPPGSVFKIVTAVGAIEEGVIDPERQIVDKGLITIRNAFYPADLGRALDFVCWNRDGHGLVNLVRGIAESCNVYFYKVGGGFAEDKLEGLGIERLGLWMEHFGFGVPTGIELPGELGGFIPSRTWKRITWSENWSTGDTYNSVIGQGYVHVTPLQMLNAYNAIINGGTLYQPTLIDKYLDGEGRVITDTQPVVNGVLPVSASTLAYVRAGLRQAVTAGTLAGTFSLWGEIERPIINVPESLQVAGKTGTAEYCDAIAYPKGLCIPKAFPTHSWTALFAPYDKPEVAVIVFVYNGTEGSRMAAPIAGEILRAYFELKEGDAQRAASTSAP